MPSEGNAAEFLFAVVQDEGFMGRHTCDQPVGWHIIQQCLELGGTPLMAFFRSGVHRIMEST